MLAALFARPARHTPARRRPDRRRLAAAGSAGLIPEALESRVMLAVTATLSGTALQITYGGDGEAAVISSDGSEYSVSGTGLATTKFTVAAVDSIAVTDSSGGNQLFTVATGTALAAPLTIPATVETAEVKGAINTTKAGDIAIDSPTTKLSNSITNNGKQTYGGTVSVLAATTLTSSAALATAGITFSKPIQSDNLFTPTLTLSTAGNIVFNGTSGTLGVVTVQNANDVTLTAGSPALDCLGFVQKAGTGTTLIEKNTGISTRFDTFATGVSITTAAIEIGSIGSINTQSLDGPTTPAVTLVAQTGKIRSGGLIRAAGDVSLTAATGVELAGEVAADGTVAVHSPLTLLAGGPFGESLIVGDAGVTLEGAVSGVSTETLEVRSAAGAVRFLETVSLPSAPVTIPTATTLVLSKATTVASLSQAAGSLITLVNGPVTATGSGGVSLTSKAIGIDATIDTATAGKGGPVTLAAGAGLVGLDIAAAGTISADGPVTLSSGTVIKTAGSVTTTADPITFRSPTTLTGNVSLDTGAGPGSISFLDTLDGAARLVVAAGTGSILFNAPVGATTPLTALRLVSANSVSANAAVNVTRSDITQSTGIAIGRDVGNVTMTSGGTVSGAYDAGIDIQAPASATASRTISNFTVTLARRGVAIGSADGGDHLHLTLAGNLITASVLEGIFVGVEPGTDMTGAQITRNTISGTTGLAGKSGYGILFGGTGTANDIRGLAVIANTITDNASDGIRFNLGNYSGTSLTSNTVNGNKGAGVNLAGAVTGLAIGTAASGNTITGNSTSGVAVADGSTAVVIEGNRVAGNLAAGIRVVGSTTDGVSLRANRIGVDATGLAPSGNGGQGVVISDARNTLIDGNTISGNARFGVVITGAATNTTLSGNRIGLGTDAATAVPNAQSGVWVQGSATGTAITGNSISSNKGSGVQVTTGATATTIGGAGRLANTINGNQQYGVTVSGIVTGSSVIGNSIGSNAIYGMYLNGAQGLSVGAAVQGAGNLIEKSQQGIVAGGTLAATTISGNTIVSNPSGGVILLAAQGLRLGGGNSILSNTSYGVFATGVSTGTSIDGNTISDNAVGLYLSDASGIRIGSDKGTSLPDVLGNTISGNTSVGIIISGAAATSNPILSNSIVGNGVYGIQLVGGGNASQPAPTLYSASTTTVKGALAGPAGTYLIQYFKTPAAETLGAGQAQGKTLLASKTVVIVGGSASIEQAISGVVAGDWITTTATLLAGGTTPTNTSAFSVGMQVA